MRVLLVTDGSPDADLLAEVVAAHGTLVTVRCADEAAVPEALRRALAAPCDVVVFWGTEAVAAQFLAFGRGGVIVPGDTSRPAAYWQQFAPRGRFLTASRAMHEMLEASGCRAVHVDPWPAAPPPVARDVAPGTWRAVLFAPEASADAGTVAGAVAGAGAGKAAGTRRDAAVAAAVARCRALGIGHLVVVTAAADGAWRDPFVAISTARRAPDTLFVFADGLSLAAIRAAQAAGRIVVAADVPPARETVGHLASGVLVDPERPEATPLLTEALARRLSTGARQKAEIGRRAWRADAPRIVSFLAGDGARWSRTDAGAHLGNAIQRRLHLRRRDDAAR